MISNRNRGRRLKKTTAAGVIFLFLFNGLSSLPAEEANLPEKAGAYTEDGLAPPTGLANPETREDVLEKLWEELDAKHQKEIDEFIEAHSDEAIGLYEIPHPTEPNRSLQDEFLDVIEHCQAFPALDTLNQIFLETATEIKGQKAKVKSPRIQVIFVDRPEDLPEFEGRPVWGHAGTFVTAFAVRGEKTAPEGRARIIGRIFHEIRARSRRALEKYEETPPKTVAEARGQMADLERENEEIEGLIRRHILEGIDIKDHPLILEFARLGFDYHPARPLRDYTAKEKPPPAAYAGKLTEGELDEDYGWNLGKVVEKFQIAGVKGGLYGFFERNKLISVVKKELLRRLAENEWDIRLTADTFGISERTLRRLMSQCNIEKSLTLDKRDLIDKYKWNLGDILERYEVTRVRGGLYDLFERSGLLGVVKTEVLRRLEENNWRKGDVAVSFNLEPSTFAYLRDQLDIKRPSVSEDKLRREYKWNLGELRKRLNLKGYDGGLYGYLKDNGLVSAFKKEFFKRTRGYGWQTKALAKSFGIDDQLLRDLMDKCGIEPFLNSTYLKTVYRWDIGNVIRDFALRAAGEGIYEFFEKNGLGQVLKEELQKRLAKSGWRKSIVAKSFHIYPTTLNQLIAGCNIQPPSITEDELIDEYEWNLGRIVEEFGVKGRGGLYEFFKEQGLATTVERELHRRLKRYNWGTRAVADSFGLWPSTFAGLMADFDIQTPTITEDMLKNKYRWNIGRLIKEYGLGAGKRLGTYQFFKENGLALVLKDELLQRLNKHGWNRSAVARELHTTPGIVNSLITESKIRRPRITRATIEDEYSWNLGRLREDFGSKRSPGGFYRLFQENGLVTLLRDKLYELLRENGWNKKAVAGELHIDAGIVDMLVTRCRIRKPRITKTTIADDYNWNLGALIEDYGLRYKKGGAFAFFRDNKLVPALRGKLYELLEEHRWSVNAVADILGVDGSTVVSLMDKCNIEKPAFTEASLRDEYRWNLGAIIEDYTVRGPGGLYEFFKRHRLLTVLKRELHRRIKEHGWRIRVIADSFNIDDVTLVRLMDNCGIQKPKVTEAILRKYKWDLGAIIKDFGLRGGRHGGLYGAIEDGGCVPALRSKLSELLEQYGGKKRPVADELHISKSLLNVLISKCNIVALPWRQARSRPASFTPRKFSEELDTRGLLGVCLSLTGRPQELQKFVSMFASGLNLSLDELNRLIWGFRKLNLEEVARLHGYDISHLDFRGIFIKTILEQRVLVAGLEERDQGVLIKMFLRMVYREYSKDPQAKVGQFKRELEAAKAQSKDEEVKAFLEKLKARVAEEFSKEVADFSPPHIRKGALRPHQSIGAYRLRTNDRFALLDGTRTAKTRQALAALDIERRNLIVSPAGVVDTWFEEERLSFSSDLDIKFISGENTDAEIAEFLSELTKDDYIIVGLRGDATRRNHLLKALQGRQRTILHVSYTTLRNMQKASLDLIQNDKKGKYCLDAAVLDEWQLAENYTAVDREVNAQQAAVVQKITPPRRWILSATPYRSDPHKLYALFHYLIGDREGPPAWANDGYVFKHTFTDDMAGFRLLSGELANISLRRSREDVWEPYEGGRVKQGVVTVPRPAQRLHEYEMTEDMTHYSLKMVDSFIGYVADIYNQTVEPDERLDIENLTIIEKLKFLRYLQVDPQRVGLGIDTPYWDGLDKEVERQLKDPEHKIVIFAQNVFIVDEIIRRYNELHGEGTCVRIDGQVTGWAKDDEGKIMEDEDNRRMTQKSYNRHRFQKEPKVRICVANVRAGLGIDLSRADGAIYAQMPQTYSEFYQSMSRILGPNQPGHLREEVPVVFMCSKYPKEIRAKLKTEQDQVYFDAGTVDQIQWGRLSAQQMRFGIIVEGAMPLASDPDIASLVRGIPGFIMDPSLQLRRDGEDLSPRQRVALQMAGHLGHLYAIANAKQKEAIVELIRDANEMNVDLSPLAKAISDIPDFDLEDLVLIASLKDIPNRYLRHQLYNAIPDVLGHFYKDNRPLAINASHYRSFGKDGIPDFLITAGLIALCNEKGFQERMDALTTIAEGIRAAGTNKRLRYQELVTSIDGLRSAPSHLLDIFTDDSVLLDIRLSVMRELALMLPFIRESLNEAFPRTIKSFDGLRQRVGEVRTAAAIDYFKQEFDIATDEAGINRLDGYGRDFLLNIHRMNQTLKKGKETAKTAFKKGLYLREGSRLSELVSHTLDGTYPEWRNKQEGPRGTGLDIDYIQDEDDFWEIWTQEEHISSDTRGFARLKNLNVRSIDIEMNIKTELLFIINSIEQNPNLLDSIENRDARVLFEGYLKDRQFLKTLERNRRDLGQIHRKVLQGRGQELSNQERTLLKDEGIAFSSGRAPSDILNDINTRLDTLSAAYFWMQLSQMEQAGQIDKSLLSRMPGRTQGAELPNEVQKSITNLDRLLGSKPQRYSNVEISVTSDPSLILKRGELNDKLVNCFELDGDPEFVRTLLDDLGSRNKMLITVKARGQYQAVAVAKIKQDEEGEPVIFLESILWQKGGYDFQEEILEVLRKRKAQRMSQRPSLAISTSPRNLEAVTLYSTGGYDEEEYSEAHHGIKKNNYRKKDKTTSRYTWDITSQIVWQPEEPTTAGTRTARAPEIRTTASRTRGRSPPTSVTNFGTAGTYNEKFHSKTNAFIEENIEDALGIVIRGGQIDDGFSSADIPQDIRAKMAAYIENNGEAFVGDEPYHIFLFDTSHKDEDRFGRDPFALVDEGGERVYAHSGTGGEFTGENRRSVYIPLLAFQALTVGEPGDYHLDILMPEEAEHARKKVAVRKRGHTPAPEEFLDIRNRQRDINRLEGFINKYKAQTHTPYEQWLLARASRENLRTMIDHLTALAALTSDLINPDFEICIGSRESIRALVEAGAVTKGDLKGRVPLSELVAGLGSSDSSRREVSAGVIKMFVEIGAVTEKDLKGEKIPLIKLISGVKSPDYLMRSASADAIEVLVETRAIAKKDLRGKIPMDGLIAQLKSSDRVGLHDVPSLLETLEKIGADIKKDLKKEDIPLSKLISYLGGSDAHMRNVSADTLRALVKVGALTKEDLKGKIPLDELTADLESSEHYMRLWSAYSIKTLVEIEAITKDELREEIPLDTLILDLESPQDEMCETSATTVRLLAEAGAITKEELEGRISLDALQWGLVRLTGYLREEFASLIKTLVDIGAIKKRGLITEPILHTLIFGLGSSDGYMRRRTANAIKTLAEIGAITKTALKGKIPVDELASGLGSPDESMRHGSADAIKALAEIGAITKTALKGKIPVDELASGLGSPDSFMRSSSAGAIKTLAEIGAITKKELKKEKVPLTRLISGLSAPDGHMRSRSADAIKVLKDIGTLTKEDLAPLTLDELKWLCARISDERLDNAQRSLIHNVSTLIQNEIRIGDVRYLQNLIKEEAELGKVGVILETMCHFSLRGSDVGSAAAQQYFEGMMDSILSRKVKKGADYIEVGDKEKLIIEYALKGFRQVKLRPFVYNSNVGPEVRLMVIRGLAERGTIDSEYLNIPQGQEQTYLELISRLHEKFAIMELKVPVEIPPKVLVDKIASNEATLEDVLASLPKLERIESEKDSRQLIKALAEDEGLMLTYYCMRQAPFHYPGTAPISFERFRAIVNSAADSLGEVRHQVVSGQLRSSFIRAGMDKDAARQVCQRLLRGSAPFPDGSPYLDEGGSFRPQRVDVLERRAGQDNAATIAQQSFGSARERLITILKVNRLLKRIQEGINKIVTEPKNKQAFRKEYDDIVSALEQGTANMADGFGSLKTLDNQIYTKQVPNLDGILENDIQKVLGRALIEHEPYRPLFGQHKKETTEPSLSNIEINNLVRNVEVLGDSPIEELRMFLKGLKDKPKKAKIEEGHILNRYFDDAVGHLAAAFENYLLSLKKVAPIAGTPVVIYLDYIDKGNIMEALRFADGAHCCNTSDPKINEGYGGGIYDENAHRWLTDATTFFFQLTTEERGGDQIGWLKCWFGLDENGLPFVGSNYIYLAPRYQDEELEREILSKVEEILFSIHITRLAQADAEGVPTNSLPPPDTYKKTTLNNFRRLQSLDDGESIKADVAIEGNTPQTAEFFVKDNEDLVLASAPQRREAHTPDSRKGRSPPAVTNFGTAGTYNEKFHSKTNAFIEENIEEALEIVIRGGQIDDELSSADIPQDIRTKVAAYIENNGKAFEGDEPYHIFLFDTSHKDEDRFGRDPFALVDEGEEKVYAHSGTGGEWTGENRRSVYIPLLTFQALTVGEPGDYHLDLLMSEEATHAHKKVDARRAGEEYEETFESFPNRQKKIDMLKGLTNNFKAHNLANEAEEEIVAPEVKEAQIPLVVYVDTDLIPKGQQTRTDQELVALRRLYEQRYGKNVTLRKGSISQGHLDLELALLKQVGIEAENIAVVAAESNSGEIPDDIEALNRTIISTVEIGQFVNIAPIVSFALAKMLVSDEDIPKLYSLYVTVSDEKAALTEEEFVRALRQREIVTLILSEPTEPFSKGELKDLHKQALYLLKQA